MKYENTMHRSVKAPRSSLFPFKVIQTYSSQKIFSSTPATASCPSPGFCLRPCDQPFTVCARKRAKEVPVTLGKIMTKQPLSTDQLTELTTGLNRLARNLWWTWNQEAQEIFQELSPRGWQNLYHNAVAILHEVSDYELRVRLQDYTFADRVRHVLKSFKTYLNEESTWGKVNAPSLLQNPVAYFTAEFGFHETLPIAAGRLGNLAGGPAQTPPGPRLGFVRHPPFFPGGHF